MSGLHPDLALLTTGNRELYSFFVLLGGALGGAYVRAEAAAWPLPAWQRWAVLGSTLFGALAGSAVPAFLAGGVVAELARSQLVGPKSIVGGLFFGYVLASIVKWLLRISFDTSDAFATGTALMMAIGRLGCSFYHCCFGRAVDEDSFWSWLTWDLGDHRLRIAVQPLEAALMFLVFGTFDQLRRRRLLVGSRLPLLFLGYGCLRFTLEFLREPVANELYGLGAYQWFALALAGTGGFMLLRRSLRGRTGSPPPEPPPTT